MSKRTPKPVSVEIIGAQITVEFVVREGGAIVDRGTLQAPPLFTATQARRWFSRQERDLLDNVRKAREAS